MTTTSLNGAGRAKGEEERAPIADPFAFRYGASIARARTVVAPLVTPYMIRAGRPTLLTAYAGVGKTMLFLELAIAVATKRKTAWGGAIEVRRHGPVRLVDYEMGEDDTDDRIQRLAFGHGVDVAQLGTMLGVSSMPPIYLSSDPEEVEEAMTTAMAGVVMCGIDNLAAATPHAPKGMNDASIRIYLDLLNRVSQRTGCVFVVLTHDGKSSGKGGGGDLQRMRNSSAIADAAGNVLSASAKDDVITIAHAKHPHGQKAKDARVQIHDVGEPRNLGEWAKDRRPGLAIRLAAVTNENPKAKNDADAEVVRAAIIAAVSSAKEPLNVRALLETVRGFSGKRIKAALAELRADGTIEEVDGSRGAKILRIAGREDDLEQAF